MNDVDVPFNYMYLIICLRDCFVCSTLQLRSGRTEVLSRSRLGRAVQQVLGYDHPR